MNTPVSTTSGFKTNSESHETGHIRIALICAARSSRSAVQDGRNWPALEGFSEDQVAGCTIEKWRTSEDKDANTYVIEISI